MRRKSLQVGRLHPPFPVAGIDPGISGAICYISTKGCIEFFDTPIQERQVKSKRKGKIVTLTKRTMHIYEAANMLSDLRGRDANMHVLLEQVQPHPKQGVVSTGSLMRNYGEWRGLLAGTDCLWDCVTPQKWKRSLNILRTEKEHAIVKANHIYPAIGVQLYGDGATKEQAIGRADAFLIAYYLYTLVKDAPDAFDQMAWSP